MKFTHVEIEAERRKPVGSLFMHLMDRDSMPSRAHRNREARRLNDHSLPNTALSFFESDDPQRCSTPIRGRRHFPKQNEHFDCINSDAKAAAAIPNSSRSQRRATPVAGPDHLRSNLTPREDDGAAYLRQKRYIPEPGRRSIRRCFWLGDDAVPPSSRTSSPAPTQGSSSAARQRPPLDATRQDHLDIGSLLPRAEPEKQRLIPPPMIKKPRTTGIRLFPEHRSRSVDDHRRGVRMVAPQSHWRSAADRQWDFLEIGVDHRETPAPLYRNESSIGVGGGPVLVRDISTGPSQRWRGRCRSATPHQRRFDIITGRPC